MTGPAQKSKSTEKHRLYESGAYFISAAKSVAGQGDIFAANMAHIMGKSALSALTNCPHKLSHFPNQFHKIVAISVHIYLRSHFPVKV